MQNTVGLTIVALKVSKSSAGTKISKYDNFSQLLRYRTFEMSTPTLVDGESILVRMTVPKFFRMSFSAAAAPDT
jgi:hypothetical protein